MTDNAPHQSKDTILDIMDRASGNEPPVIDMARVKMARGSDKLSTDSNGERVEFVVTFIDASKPVKKEEGDEARAI